MYLLNWTAPWEVFLENIFPENFYVELERHLCNVNKTEKYIHQNLKYIKCFEYGVLKYL